MTTCWLPGRLGQGRHDVVDVDPAPRHGVGELVQHVEAVRLGGQVPLDLRPALGRVGGVVGLGALPARPAPAAAHLVPDDRGALAGLVVQPAERGQRVLLADLPLRALDELVDRDRPALVPGAHGHAERGRGLALHLAGVHGQQRPVPALPRGEPVGGHGRDLSLRHVRPPSARCGRSTASDSAASSSRRSVRAPSRAAEGAGQPQPHRPGLAVDDDPRRPARGEQRGRGVRVGQVTAAARTRGPAVGDDDQQRTALRIADAARPAAARARAAGRRPAGCGRRWAGRSAGPPPRPPTRWAAARASAPRSAEGDQADLVAALVGVEQQRQDRPLDRAHPRS